MMTLLVDLAVIVVTARVLAVVAERFGQPAVIGELVGGIALGPTILGAVPGLDGALFPLHARADLGALGEVGLVVFMLLVGLELDLTSIRRQRRAALTVSAASFGVPFGLGIAAALPLSSVYGRPGAGWLAFALFLGTAVSVTALPVLARLLSESGLDRTELGALALACAGIQDAFTWILLAASLGIAAAAGVGSGVRLLAEGVLFIAGMFLVVRPALRVACAKLGTSEALVALAVAGAAGAAAISDAIGIQPVIGAFAFGVAFPRRPAVSGTVQERLGPMTLTVLLPVFFFLPGLSVNLRQLGEADVGALVLVLVVACAGKLAGTMAAACRVGLARRDAGMLGLLMNTRGLVELVVLNAGLSAGILDRRLYGVLLIVAIVTTLMTRPLLGVLQRGHRARAPALRHHAAGARAVLAAALTDVPSEL